MTFPDVLNTFSSYNMVRASKIAIFDKILRQASNFCNLRLIYQKYENLKYFWHFPKTE